MCWQLLGHVYRGQSSASDEAAAVVLRSCLGHAAAAAGLAGRGLFGANGMA